MHPAAGMDQLRGEARARPWSALASDVDQRLAELHRRISDLREQQLREGGRAEEELAAFARTDGAPVELREVQRRIDRGELSWEQVVLGSGGDAAARGVRTLLGRQLAPLPELMERTRELVEVGGVSPEEAAQRASVELSGEQEGGRPWR